MSRAKYDKVNDRLILIAGKEDTSVPTFTMAEWEAMTDAQKAEYDGKLFVISDDFNGMTVDDELSITSVHPVQNKVITEELANCAEKTDLTNIKITGSTNNTGATIYGGTFFYKDGVLVKAIKSIANGATLTLNTNYKVVTAGVLNEENPCNLSTTERVVGKDENGKTIYQITKTVSGTLTNPTYGSPSYIILTRDLLGFNATSIKSVSGCYTASSDTRTQIQAIGSSNVNLNTVGTVYNNLAILIDSAAGNTVQVVYQTTSYFGCPNISANITIRYTKD